MHPFNSSITFSSSGNLIVNNGGNVLVIGYALIDVMPEFFMFILMNAVSMACVVFRYFIKNKISVITRRMSHVKAAYEQMTELITELITTTFSFL